MLFIIVVFLSFLQSVIGFTLMSSSTMHFKEPIKQRMILGFIIMFLGISLLTYTLYIKGTNSVDKFAILIILVIELSWFLVCSKDSFFVSMFSFLTFVNIYISISYISDHLVIHSEGVPFVLERVFIRMIIYIVLIPLLFKRVRKSFHKLVDTLDKEWRAGTLVPLVFLIMQMMVLYYPEPYWKWEESHWSKFIIITVYILFLSVYYLLYIQASAIVEKYALEKKQLLMAQQDKLWESELIRQKAIASLANRQRHDMHHHNAVIKDLIKSGDLTNLETYMISFDKSINKYSDHMFCLNPIANSIINLYDDRAKKNNIKTIFHVNIPERIGIENIDLTCVLGNVLENALEGCQRLPEEEDKEISVTIKYIDFRLRIQVENTCRQDIQFEGELPMTQKEIGGTGTKSIIYTAEYYDGTAGFSVTGNKFITQIVLNSNLKE